MREARLHHRAVYTGLTALCAAIFTVLAVSPRPVSAQKAGDEFLTVDCLLPGQVRKLGRKLTFLAPRRPVRTSQGDCEIRGGEYVSYDRASYATALQIWLPLAQKGDTKAQTYVGEMAEKGLGQAPDYEMAALWYRRAANHGYAPAQTNLGHLYENGLGVPKNMKTAIMWYRRASNLDEARFEKVAFGDPIKEIQNLQTALRQRTGEVEALRAEIAGLKQELNQTKEERRRVSKRLAAEKEALQEERRALAQRRQSLQAERLAFSRVREKSAATPSADTDRASNQGVDESKAAIEKEKTRLTNQAEALAEHAKLLERERQAFLANKQKEEKAVADAQETAAKEAMAAESRDKAKELERSEKALKELEVRFAKREEELKSLGKQLTQLDTKIESGRLQIVSLEQGNGVLNSEVTDDRPRIEIIEPRLQRVRGNATAYTRYNSKFRTIVGKVVAPNGLYGLFVNDNKVKVDSDSMFQTRVPLATGETRVQVVVLDKAGQRSELTFSIWLDEGGQIEATQATEGLSVKDTANIEFGKYYALMIGNENYRNLPKLQTPHNDVTVLEALLSRKYGFKTKVLLDATRYQILSALNEMRAKLTETDNLLLYYAGHGELDSVNQRGNWLPVDAEPDSTANWISNVAVTDILNTMSARKIIVVADSCFSGTLTRSILARLDAGRSREAWVNWVSLMVSKKSRTAMASGGVAPVLDGGGGRHSIFAKALIDALRDNSKVLEGRTLHQIVAQGVSFAASNQQIPQYAPIKFAGHEAGDFFFVPDA